MMTAADQILTVTDLCKSYGNTEVLKQLSLSVRRGAIHGLVGLNGSGKTTTLECLLGLLPFESGSIQLLGRSPDQLHSCRGKVVSIFDSPSLNPGLTVRQTLELARLLCPKPVHTAAELEKMLGIARYSSYRIRQLSLGNRRRASIAQALAGEPELIILDEPFNGLDAGGVEEVLALISGLNQQSGTSFLLSSHQLPYLEQICSHLAVLHQGRIVLNDHIDTLFSGHHNQLNIQCDQPDRAATLLQQAAGVAEVTVAGPDSLQLRLTEASVAELNTLLVNAGIAVSGLQMEQATLTSLFHSVTAQEAKL